MILLASVSGYTAEALNLEETLTSTYNNNQVLKAAQQEFLKDIEAFPKALADFLPNISAEISTSSSKQKSSTDPKFVNPRSTQGRHSTSSGPNVSKGLTISQDVFSGGSSVLGLKAAQAAFWVARSTFYKSEQDILFKAAEAYLNVCESRESYNIANDSLEFHRQNHEMVTEKIKVGEATVTELDRKSVV